MIKTSDYQFKVVAHAFFNRARAAKVDTTDYKESNEIYEVLMNNDNLSVAEVYAKIDSIINPKGLAKLRYNKEVTKQLQPIVDSLLNSDYAFTLTLDRPLVAKILEKDKIKSVLLNHIQAVRTPVSTESIEYNYARVYPIVENRIMEWNNFGQAVVSCEMGIFTLNAKILNAENLDYSILCERVLMEKVLECLDDAYVDESASSYIVNEQLKSNNPLNTVVMTAFN